MIKDLMTTKEAAEYLDYTPEYVCNLCAKGKLEGAQKMGERMWAIPKKAVEGYRPGLQGFAAVNARKRAELVMLLSEAIRGATAMRECK